MTFYLAKPFRFQYPQPDISNFPNQNQVLAQDFNFTCELFKFFSKPVTVAFEGERLASINAEAEDGEVTHDLGGWKVTDEWYNALNEYSIPENLWEEFYSANDEDGKNKWNVRYGKEHWEGYAPTNNGDVVNYYLNDCVNLDGDGNPVFDEDGNQVLGGKDPFDYHSDWIFGFNHFNNGLFDSDSEYFWGEKVAGKYANVDFIAEGLEWNHLEEKKPLGLQGLYHDLHDIEKPKDASLNAAVNQAHFTGEFLSALYGSSETGWEEINNVLNQFPTSSYYQIVMDATQGKYSYKNLSSEEKMLLVAAMIESRNRVFSISEKIFGPVANTWNDEQMMDHLSTWLSQHANAGNSHAINAFRMLLNVQHQFINTVTMFHEVNPGEGYSMAMLDRYGFWEFAKEIGVEFYKGDSDEIEGTIFEHIQSDLGIEVSGDIRTFLGYDTDLNYLSIHSKPGDIDLTQYLSEGLLNDLSATQKNKLKAFKWLLEQWFGATKVRAGYNSMPKWEGYTPKISIWDGNQGITSIGGWNVIVPESIYDPSSARSYAWDRVVGPFNENTDLHWGHSFGLKKNGEWGAVYESSTWGTGNDIDGVNAWQNIISSLRSLEVDGEANPYGMPYISPYANKGIAHKNYTRWQFGNLDSMEICGQGTNNAGFMNSWPVFIEGMLTRYGQKRSKMRLFINTFMGDNERIRFRREQEEYQEKKEDIKNEELAVNKANARMQANRRKQQKGFEKGSMQDKNKLRKAEKKQLYKMLARKKQANKRASSAKKPQKSAKKA